MTLKLVLVGGLLFVFSFNAHGQTVEPGTARKVLNKSATTGVVVVGTAAKYTWKATKFTGKRVAKPVVVKGAPAAGRFVLKQSGKAVKISYPVVKKFAVTYLKFRLSP